MRSWVLLGFSGRAAAGPGRPGRAGRAAPGRGGAGRGRVGRVVSDAGLGVGAGERLEGTLELRVDPPVELDGSA